jgi:AcrR family transcriptional regulator
MPYAAGHGAEVKKRIVDSARQLFNRHGFESVSIVQIMASAGLTHGGFYSYFKSKSDLYAEVLGCFFTDPDWKHCWEGVHVDLRSKDVGPQIVRAYLSRQHLEDVENSCPMVALRPTSRAAESARRAFRPSSGDGERAERSIATDRKVRPTTARAIAAMCVGGMVIARSLVDRRIADELRDACIAKAIELGGWRRKRAATAARRTTRV